MNLLEQSLSQLLRHDNFLSEALLSRCWVIGRFLIYARFSLAYLGFLGRLGGPGSISTCANATLVWRATCMVVLSAWLSDIVWPHLANPLQGLRVVFV